MVYVAGKSSDSLARELGLENIIKLGSNESPIGPSTAAITAMGQAALRMHLYPGLEGADLADDIAARNGVASEQVVIGNGSSDILLKAAEVILRDGGEAIIPEPCFSMYEVAVDWAGGRQVKVAANDYRFDVDGILAAITAQTRMIFLTNPNNPTGLPLSGAEIERVLDGAGDGITVILDEAYCEYVPEADRVDGTSYVRDGRNVLVTRTFSKIYALAGMRVGYGIGLPELVSGVKALVPPFYSGSLSLIAARESFKDEDHLERSCVVNAEGRDYLSRAFSDLGLRVLPSVANHVLIVDMEGVETVDRLMNARGFIARPTKSSFGLPGGYRITVGTFEQNQAFVANLTEVLAALA